MATVTPNFNWPVPTSTDLVKDGATAIEALGDSIDASLLDLKGGTTGQVLSKNSNTDMDFVWVTDPGGDITGVTAGTGISGGGTSGTVTVTNSMATAITTKGDLVPGTGSGTFARLAAGANGETLVADSSTSTGLRYQGNFAAGKNQCINGAFDIWQRGTSFSANVYTADRWTTQTDKTLTVSRQTFTAGTAPVAGYEGTFFLRQTYSAGGNYGALQTKLEDVRLFAGQTITLSYWAKADATYSNTPSVSQNFGSGGSGGVGTNGTTHNITTTWTRYSSVITVPSISGKTIGTSSFFMLQPILIESTGARTIDIWGVQVEVGNTATAFQTATGTIQGELGACQRYLPAISGLSYEALGFTYSTTGSQYVVKLPVTARVAPTGMTVSNVSHFTVYNTGFSGGNPTALTMNTSSIDTFSINATTTAGSPILVSSTPVKLQITNASGSILFTGCEL